MFKSRLYSSDEEYDIAKFLNYEIDVYDVLNSPLLNGLKALPVKGYYSTDKGFKDIDIISAEVYGDSFFAFYLQFYNDITDEVLPEVIVLKLFDLSDFTTLCGNLLIGEG